MTDCVLRWIRVMMDKMTGWTGLDRVEDTGDKPLHVVVIKKSVTRYYVHSTQMNGLLLCFYLYLF